MKKLTRWVALFDTHGDKVAAPALAAAREFVADFKPDIRIHGGDAFDLRWLRKAATDAERYEDLEADLEAGYDLFRWYKPTVVVWGNHDWRLHKAMHDASGATRKLAALLVDQVADQLPSGCETFEYCKRKGVYAMGDHRVIHGFTSGATAVRSAAMAYGNVLMGHIHRVERVQVNGVEDRIGYACGCLCQLDLDYNRASLNTLPQRHGFAYGFLVDGRAVVFLATPVNGRWVFPTEFREVRSGEGEAKSE